MCFEIKEADLLGRIGRLETKSGVVETPLFLPVVNPSSQPIPPRKISDLFGCGALITNAYILKNRFQGKPAREGLHEFLDFDGVIMTDSGAYQLLIYDDIEVTATEIVEYQEQIDTDIATILDYPTGWKVSRKHAEETVSTTVRRAREYSQIKTRDDILWVGPVQGGTYLDLVAQSAQEMSSIPFHIHALGSPTQIMQQYQYDTLADMILTAKMNLPLNRPLHLFGAGHPLTFSLAVALGCDLFDSAAYAIYARNHRYLSTHGTYKLDELEYFPCRCPRCTKATPQKIHDLSPEEREIFLAEHNLHTCQVEIQHIKQTIKEGRLWEHLHRRAHGHTALLQALKKLKKYQDYIEKHSPITKRGGIFYFNSSDLARSEIVRHRERLRSRYIAPKEATILLLIPQTKTRPFSKSREFKATEKTLKIICRNDTPRIHICFYSAPFGLTPIELDEVYPLSQHETTLPLDEETRQYVAAQTLNYIRKTNYETVILLHDPEIWSKSILTACEKACGDKSINFQYLNIKSEQTKTTETKLGKLLQTILSEKH